MSRIETMLSRLAGEQRKALVPFICAGDPDLELSAQAVMAAVEAGADLIELGVPFSDPIADGPVIQAASQRALAGGASLPRILEMVAGLRAKTDVPIVLFGYCNPYLRYGEERLACDARAAGIDGILCVDQPPEESAALVAACRDQELDRIFLLAPTSDAARMEAVAAVASGFVYFVSVTGVTGARAAAPEGIAPMVERVRAAVGLPVGVGFGISTPAQAAAVGAYADLVVVGSALVRTMYEAGPGSVDACREFVAGLRAGMDGERTADR